MPVDQLFRPGDERYAIGDARQIEQPLDLRRSLHKSKSAAFPGEPLVRAHDDAQPRGVHELELAQVDDHQFGVRRRDVMELRLQLRTGGEVELSADGDHRGAAISLHFDSELTLHWVEPIDLERHMRSIAVGLRVEWCGNGT